METVQLWKARHLQYVLRQKSVDFHSIPMVALHPEEFVAPRGAAAGEFLALAHRYHRYHRYHHYHRQRHHRSGCV